MHVLTLGAASRLANQGKDLGFAAATMLMFGLGAAAPLVLVGAVSRSTLANLRGGLGHAGRWGKLWLGGGMLAACALAVGETDTPLEIWLVDASPNG